MTITFHNAPELPLEFIQTFGVNAKETDHPIGHFGTGLKYAIAVLLRENCKVVICIGEHVYKFTKKKQVLRGKEFEFCYMDDHMLAFTTELGKNWMLWMAYRELYSNCMDENGVVYAYEYGPMEGTSIMVEGEAFDEIHELRGEFILLTKPKYVLDQLEVHESLKPGIFYKGIRVLTMPTKYSYNILSDLTLTEDRTAHQWDVEFAITKAFSTSNNVTAIVDFLTIDEEKYHEPKFNYSKYVDPSSEFMALISKLKKKPHNAGGYYSHHSDNFIGGVPKNALSRRIREKIVKLYDLMTFKPQEVYVVKMNEDYKIVKQELALNHLLLKDPRKLAFVYMFACHKMQKPKLTDYQIITELMLEHFQTPDAKP